MSGTLTEEQKEDFKQGLRLQHWFWTSQKERGRASQMLFLLEFAREAAHPEESSGLESIKASVIEFCLLQKSDNKPSKRGTCLGNALKSTDNQTLLNSVPFLCGLITKALKKKDKEKIQTLTKRDERAKRVARMQKPSNPDSTLPSP